MQTDVLIIGAGPAGATAATRLARAGCRVVLADRHAFPRDKVCGDALIPDALAALEALGLGAAVGEAARPLARLRIHAPDGTHVDVPGRLACLPRLRLDAMLQQAALEAGAHFLPRHLPLSALEAGGRVAGARLRDESTGMVRGIRAHHVLLATGAAAEPLELFGVCERRAPSGVAARCYVQADATLAAEFDHLAIAFERPLLPGYGWIFPGPEGVFNLGVGCFRDAGGAKANLREQWRRFVAHFEPARRLLGGGRLVGPLAGAPLRTALAGAAMSRPGLLVIGEAAGTTYSFTGEGIGKAMSSALTAAEAILEGGGGMPPETLYPQRFLARHAARFAAYRKAQRWLGHPALCDWLAGRARRGRFVAARLAGLLAESEDPQRLFSARGLMRSMWG